MLHRRGQHIFTLLGGNPFSGSICFPSWRRARRERILFFLRGHETHSRRIIKPVNWLINNQSAQITARAFYFVRTANRVLVNCIICAPANLPARIYTNIDTRRPSLITRRQRGQSSFFPSIAISNCVRRISKRAWHLIRFQGTDWQGFKMFTHAAYLNERQMNRFRKKFGRQHLTRER